MADYDFLSVSNGSGDAALMHVNGSGRTVGSTVIPVDSVVNVPAKFIATYGVVGANGLITSASKRDFKGHVSGSTLVIDGFEPGSTDNGNSVGDIVIVKPNTGWADRVAKFIKNATNYGTPEAVTFGAVTAASIALPSGALGPMPSGVMLPFAGSSAPAGYLLADGTAVSRSTYGPLFTIIGTTYGAGDGTTTFNLPDTRGRSLAGQAASGTFGTLGGKIGVETVDLSHVHATDVQGNHSHGGGTGYFLNNGGGSDIITTHTGSSPPSHYHGIGLDGNHGHNIDVRLSSTQSIVQPTLVVKHIIKT
jgi:hypothetical protein